MVATQIYTKLAIDRAAQLAHLKAKGLTVHDDAAVLNTLQRVVYNRLLI